MVPTDLCRALLFGLNKCNKTMQTGLNKQEARTNNLESRLFNRRIREDHITLHPLYKVRAGHGNAFQAPPGTRVPDLGPVAAVGTMYPGFPVNFDAVGGHDSCGDCLFGAMGQ